MRKDNYMYITSSNGKPLCQGAMDLYSFNKISKKDFLTMREPIVIEVNHKYHIILPVKDADNFTLTETRRKLTPEPTKKH